MSSAATKRDRYHHGDLRRALIAYAIRRIRSGGVEDFSLREAARTAGVTSGAVYKHFADKEALIRAAAAEGFRLFGGRMQRDTAGLSGQEKLTAMGQSYIGFAEAEPRLFRLMFSKLGMRALAELSADLANGLLPQQQFRSAFAEDADLAALAWSVVHGAASLICDGVWKRNDPRAEAAMRKLRQLRRHKR